MKKYRVFIISLICIAGAIGLVFSFYVTPTMAQKLDNNINNMMDKIEKGANSDLNTQLSSNPYDYAKDNEYFQNIVDMGYPALSLIEETISKSQNNGLREYLLAIAAEEIAKVNLKTDDAGNNYQWETAKGFVEQWDKHLRNTPGQLTAILNSNRTNDEKIAALEKLGLPVVPYIIDQFNNSNSEQQQVLTSTLKDLLKDNKQAKFGSNNVNDAKTWIQDNKNKFSDFKQYIDSK